MALASLSLVVLAAFVHAGWNLLAKRAAPVGPVFLFACNLVSCIDTRVELAPDILDLARTFPDIVICVDHCAIPMARDPESCRQWRAAMDIMAESPNVMMKISGLGMCDPLWTVESIRPYVLGSIEAFGVDRVVFGTNWPVDRMFSSYPDVINAYAAIISGFPRDDQVKMFSGNAERIFRI